MRREVVFGVLILMLAGRMLGADRRDNEVNGSIEGCITDKKTGEPIKDASVRLKGTKMGALSDESGHYLIRAVTPGEYTLEFHSVGYGSCDTAGVKIRRGSGTWVDITLTQSATDLVMVITTQNPKNRSSDLDTGGACIEGCVTDSATGEPVFGASVQIKGAKLGATTGPDGKYKFCRIPPGTYTLVATGVGFNTVEVHNIPIQPRDSLKVDIRFLTRRPVNREARIHPNSGLDQLGRDGTIEGHISDSATGEAIPEATIAIRGTRVGGVTDKDGNYQIKRVTAGSYFLVVSAVGYNMLEVKNVQVVKGETTTVDVSLNAIPPNINLESK